MPGLSRLEELELRKRLLVAKSDLYRELVAADLHQIQDSTAWLTKLIRGLRMAAPIFLLIAPVLGFLKGRRALPATAWATKGVVAWKLFAKLRPVWQSVRAKLATARAARVRR